MMTPGPFADAADEDEEKVNLDDGPTEAEEDAMEAEADEAADLLDHR